MLEHAVANDLPGVYNVAGDGVLVLSEVASLLGQPAGAGPAAVGDGAGRGRRCGSRGVRIPDEMAQQLRYGRGLDNRKLKAAGFPLRYTTREAVAKFAEDLRVRELRQGGERAISLRARGRGVPALQPERPPQERACGRRVRKLTCQNACSYS